MEREDQREGLLVLVIGLRAARDVNDVAAVALAGLELEGFVLPRLRHFADRVEVLRDARHRRGNLHVGACGRDGHRFRRGEICRFLHRVVRLRIVVGGVGDLLDGHAHPGCAEQQKCRENGCRDAPAAELLFRGAAAGEALRRAAIIGAVRSVPPALRAVFGVLLMTPPAAPPGILPEAHGLLPADLRRYR